MSKENKKKRKIITINAEDMMEFAKLSLEARKKKIKEAIKNPNQ